jgi:glycyl-tRNA synthetase beta chain
MTHNHIPPLLVELLTEELPPKALARLGDAFAEGLAQRLAARDLVEGELVFERYATPRRLAVVVQNVRAVAPDRQVREKCCPCRSRSTPKASRPPRSRRSSRRSAAGGRSPSSSARTTARPRRSSSTTRGRRDARRRPAGALDETLEKLPIPKVMTYQRPDGTDEVRAPGASLDVLHGDRVVPVAAFGIDAGDTTPAIASCPTASSRSSMRAPTQTRCWQGQA